MGERIQQLLIDAKELYAKGDIFKAEAVYQEILDLDPECAEAYFKLGIICQKAGRADEAEDYYRMVLHYDPQMADAYNNLGNLLRAHNKLEDAYLLLKKSVELRPNFSEAHFNLGMTENAMGKLDQALNSYKAAIDLNPRDDSAYNNMGLILLNGKGQIKEAEACFSKAIEINPDLYDAKVNLCLALQCAGEIDKAIEGYSRLIDLKPDDKELNFYRSVAYLLKGNFREGWKEYHYRWVSKVALPQVFPYREWDGISSLSGKTLLIYTEQGLGDEIMFSSCLSDVVNKAKHCVLDCDPRMISIFKRSFPSISVHGGKKKQPDLKWLKEFEPIDFQIPIGDLPKYFRNDWADFPQHMGYLKADPMRVNFWKKRLDALGPGIKVGISWRGGLVETRKDLRSIPLNQWLPVLRLPSVQFISLQYIDCQLELEEVKTKYGINVHHWNEAINDYSETAALVCGLDMVISVCTSIVHLSGALGKATWVLVPIVPEWRYLQQGDTMPWYPSVRLLRQCKIGEWGNIMSQVAEDLIK